MKYIQSIDEVNGCYLIQHALVVLFKNIIKCFDLSQNLIWEKIIPGKSIGCKVFRDFAFIEFIDKESGFEKTISLNLDTGDVINSGLERYMVRSVSIEGFVIALKYNSDYSTNTFCIQLPFSVKWEKKFDDLPLYIDGEYLLSGIKNNISLIDDNGNIEWKFDTAEIGCWSDYDGSEKQTQVNKILGIYEDKIYILLNSGKILILDIKSGDKITILKNDKHPKFDTFGDSIELDPNNGKLIQLANQDLIEVDLHNTYTVTLTPLEDMESLNLENYSKFVFDDDFIYFTDYHHYKLGSLNRKTLKIDWIYDFPQDHDQSDNPRFGRELKLFNERLYVIDNKHTLHIFQKGSHPA